jgi:MFS family permease
MLLLAPVSGRLLNRAGGRRTLLLGAGTMCAAYAFRTVATGSVLELVVGSVLVGMGSALSLAAMPTLIMSNVPITESAAANGMNSLMRAVAGAASSAALAAVLAALTVSVDGRTCISLVAFEVIYGISAVGALVAVALALAIRGDGVLEVSAAASGDRPDTAETVVRGRVLAEAGPDHGWQPAIVTVATLEAIPSTGPAVTATGATRWHCLATGGTWPWPTPAGGRPAHRCWTSTTGTWTWTST